MGKLGKLVVIYTYPIASSTPQLHHTHHLPTLSTWSQADLEPKSHQRDDLGQNHLHLEHDSGRTGTERGKVSKLVVIYIQSTPLSTLQRNYIHHTRALTTSTWADLGSESDVSGDECRKINSISSTTGSKRGRNWENWENWS